MKKIMIVVGLTLAIAAWGDTAKAVKGLWYQASWWSDLNNMTQGAKVQATGDELYLGVIKQTGNSGFYKVSVSEK